MKNLEYLEKYRLPHPVTKNMGDGQNGFFYIPNMGINLACICSDGQGWEHVSVSLWSRKDKRIKRTPSWEEMCIVKDLFFAKDECVVQYHPTEDCYVNFDKYVLHLWKNPNIKFPTPPVVMV